MEFNTIMESFKRSILKIIVSTLVLAIPFAIIYRLFIWPVYSPNLWAVYNFFAQMFLFEHIYRLITKAVKGEEIGWVNSWIPRFIFRTFFIMLIGDAIRTYLPMILVVFSSLPAVAFYIIALIYSFAMSLLTYIFYMALISYGMNKKKRFFEGIKEAFSIARSNILFMAIITLVYSCIGLIPVVGMFLGIVIMLVSEYIRSHLYLYVYGDKLGLWEDSDDYDSNYEEDYSGDTYERY